MKLIILLFIAFSFTRTAKAESIFDGVINFTAEKIFDIKVSTIYEKAMSCNQLEVDYKNGNTVREWMEKKPEMPDWRSLNNLLEVAYQARDYAQSKIGSDKVRHCLAGCFIRKKLDEKSAIMVGWLKELSDASDCTTESRFEEADYYATAAGAIAGKSNNCQSFCQRDDVKNSTGDHMLEIALRENHWSFEKFADR